MLSNKYLVINMAVPKYKSVHVCEECGKPITNTQEQMLRRRNIGEHWSNNCNKCGYEIQDKDLTVQRLKISRGKWAKLNKKQRMKKIRDYYK